MTELQGKNPEAALGAPHRCHDGAGPVANAWRAHVLDPMDVPRFDALSIDDEGGLGGGTWTWRVAALYGPSDVANPGGESLPGDPVMVELPPPTEAEGGGLSVALTWTPVDRAVGYRVYRTPVADEPGTEEWVGDTTGTTFVDTGRVPPVGGVPVDFYRVKGLSPCTFTPGP